MSKPAPAAALTSLARLLARAAAQDWLRQQGVPGAASQPTEDHRPSREMERPDAKNVA